MMGIRLSDDAYAEIEGEWNGFRFRRVEPKDYEAALDHIGTYFVRDEPTCKLLGYSEAFANDFKRLAAEMLPDHLSFLAEDVATGEIAGLRVTFHGKKDLSFDHVIMETYEAKLLCKLISEVEEKADIPHATGCDEWAEFFVASTAPQFRQRGLAGEFYKRSIKFLKKCGFKYAAVIVSSPFTRIATEKQGFSELHCVVYRNWKDFEGKPVFPLEKLDDSVHFACVRVKAL